MDNARVKVAQDIHEKRSNVSISIQFSNLPRMGLKNASLHATTMQ